MVPSSGDTTAFNVILGTCYSVWMTVQYVGWNAGECRTVIHAEYQVPSIALNAVVSPDEGPIVTRNM